MNASDATTTLMWGHSALAVVVDISTGGPVSLCSMSGTQAGDGLPRRTGPPLTTVDLNLEQLGETAVRYLFAPLDGQTSTGVMPAVSAGRARVDRCCAAAP